MSRLYVGDLGNHGPNRQELMKIFSDYGEVDDVWVAKNPPGFAFVYFKKDREARDAVRGMDGKSLNGKRIRVEVATGGKELEEMREIRRIRSEEYANDGGPPKRPISVSPPRYQGSSSRYSGSSYGSQRGRGSQRDSYGSRRGQYSSYSSSSGSSFSRDGRSSYRGSYEKRDSYGSRFGGSGRPTFTRSNDYRQDSGSSYRGRYNSGGFDRSRNRGSDGFMSSRYDTRSRSRSPQHSTSYSGYRSRGNDRDSGRDRSPMSYDRGGRGRGYGRSKYSGPGSYRGRGYGGSRYGSGGDNRSSYSKYRQDDDYHSRGSYRDDSNVQSYGDESGRTGSSYSDSYDRTQRKSSWARDDPVD